MKKVSKKLGAWECIGEEEINGVINTKYRRRLYHPYWWFMFLLQYIAFLIAFMISSLAVLLGSPILAAIEVHHSTDRYLYEEKSE